MISLEQTVSFINSKTSYDVLHNPLYTINIMYSKLIFSFLIILLFSCSENNDETNSVIEKNHLDTTTINIIQKSIKQTSIESTDTTISTNTDNTSNNLIIHQKEESDNNLGGFTKYKEYQLDDTIRLDITGDGINENIYFVDSTCRHLIIEKNNKTFDYGCNTLQELNKIPNSMGWVDYWCIVYDATTFEVLIEGGEIIGDTTVKLESPSLYIGKQEAGGGIIHWKQDDFWWIHQSD